MPAPWLSVVIPSAGTRLDGITHTLDSIYHQPGSDRIEVLVVADTFEPTERQQFGALRAIVERYPRSWRYLEHDGGLHMVGQPQRNFGQRQADGEWVAFSQDDNIMTAEALSSIWMAVATQPHRRPLFFRIVPPWRSLIWNERELRDGNIDADCLVLPRSAADQVSWGMRYQGDLDVCLEAYKLVNGDVGWCEDILAIARPEPAHLWWKR